VATSIQKAPLRDWFELGGEVAQGLRFPDHSISRQGGGILGDRSDDLNHIVNMALGIGSPGNRQSDQLHCGGRFGTIRLTAEHHCANFTTSDSTRFVKGYRERLARILQRRNVTEERLGIHVDRMAPMGFTTGTPAASSASPKYAVERIL